MSYSYSNRTAGFCQTNKITLRIARLTASYTSKGSQELMIMVSGPVTMLVVLVLFLAAFDVSAVLDPARRRLLSSALDVFVTVMTYLFKDAASESPHDLPVRAGMILTWMLAVELLRMKVDKIRDDLKNIFERTSRVVGLGCLVFFNIKSVGRKAVFSILWILCATKLVQRIVFSEVEKRLYPEAGSWLISSYMAKMNAYYFESDDSSHTDMMTHGDDLTRRCKYIVMGEEKLAQVTAYGYADLMNMNMNIVSTSHTASIITVGHVWQAAEVYPLLRDEDQSIRRVCLSFALFKLLRRRFDHVPGFTDKEARDCRNLLLRGQAQPREGWESEALLFQVLTDEVKFLSEYYHSVVPVVLASPLFVLVNYFLLPVLVLALCLISILICGHGHMSYALSRMGGDTYALQPGFARLAICALVRATHSRPAFFFTLDLSITILLLIIFFSEEIWELITVLFSNWFMLSMLCKCIEKLRKPYINGALRHILRLRRKMMCKYSNIRLKQFSLLNHPGPLVPILPATLLSLKLRSVSATDELKKSIVHCLLNLQNPPSGFSITNGKSALEKYGAAGLSWACASESVTEVILTWHIATCLMEAKLPSPTRKGAEAAAAQHQTVATTLSRYCAYLENSAVR